MTITTWVMALGLVLVFEGLGPMLFPKGWRHLLQSISQLPDSTLRRFGGALVVAGGVTCFMLLGRF